MTNLKVPRKDKSDIAYNATKAILNLIPVAGGTVSEIFTSIIDPPIEKRRNIWMQEMVNAFEKLEKHRNGIINELSNNEEFVSLLISASIYAFKTHLTEKRHELRNVLINSLGSDLSYDIQQAYLKFIDDLTPSHLIILKFVDQEEKHLQHVNEYEKIYSIMKRTKSDTNNWSLVNVEITTFRFLLKDLESKGLIFIELSA